MLRNALMEGGVGWNLSHSEQRISLINHRIFTSTQINLPTIYITQIKCWCTGGNILSRQNHFRWKWRHWNACNKSNNYLRARVFPSTLLPQIAPNLCILIICLRLLIRRSFCYKYNYKGTLRRSHDINKNNEISQYIPSNVSSSNTQAIWKIVRKIFRSPPRSSVLWCNKIFCHLKKWSNIL